MAERDRPFRQRRRDKHIIARDERRQLTADPVLDCAAAAYSSAAPGDRVSYCSSLATSVESDWNPQTLGRRLRDYGAALGRNFCTRLALSTSVVKMLPFESTARLCTQWNWPAWRPERPKAASTVPSARNRARTSLFSPSALKR